MKTEPDCQDLTTETRIPRNKFEIESFRAQNVMNFYSDITCR